MDNREIDALVAEKVMGELRPSEKSGDHPYDDLDISPGGYWFRLPNLFWSPRPFSEDIALAWKVVEKMKLTVGYSVGTAMWCCSDSLDINAAEFLESSKSAPLAICLAALKAKGIEIK
jgi:hypothetical protein